MYGVTAYEDYPKHSKEEGYVLNSSYAHFTQNFCYNRYKTCLKTILASVFTNISNNPALDCK